MDNLRFNAQGGILTAYAPWLYEAAAMLEFRFPVPLGSVDVLNAAHAVEHEIARRFGSGDLAPELPVMTAAMLSVDAMRFTMTFRPSLEAKLVGSIWKLLRIPMPSDLLRREAQVISFETHNAGTAGLERTVPLFAGKRHAPTDIGAIHDWLLHRCEHRLVLASPVAVKGDEIQGIWAAASQARPRFKFHPRGYRWARSSTAEGESITILWRLHKLDAAKEAALDTLHLLPSLPNMVDNQIPVFTCVRFGGASWLRLEAAPESLTGGVERFYRSSALLQYGNSEVRTARALLYSQILEQIRTPTGLVNYAACTWTARDDGERPARYAAALRNPKLLVRSNPLAALERTRHPFGIVVTNSRRRFEEIATMVGATVSHETRGALRSDRLQAFDTQQRSHIADTPHLPAPETALVVATTHPSEATTVAGRASLHDIIDGDIPTPVTIELIGGLRAEVLAVRSRAKHFLRSISTPARASTFLNHPRVTAGVAALRSALAADTRSSVVAAVADKIQAATDKTGREEFSVRVTGVWRLGRWMTIGPIDRVDGILEQSPATLPGNTSVVYAWNVAMPSSQSEIIGHILAHRHGLLAEAAQRLGVPLLQYGWTPLLTHCGDLLFLLHALIHARHRRIIRDALDQAVRQAQNVSKLDPRRPRAVEIMRRLERGRRCDIAYQASNAAICALVQHQQGLQDPVRIVNWNTGSI